MAAIIVLALVGMHQLLQQSCADALAAHGSHGSSLGVVDGELPPEHDAAGPQGSAIERDKNPSGVSGAVGGSACLAIVITLWLAAPLVRSRLRRPGRAPDGRLSRGPVTPVTRRPARTLLSISRT